MDHSGNHTDGEERQGDLFPSANPRRMENGVGLAALGYECATHTPTAAATHVVLTRPH